jgi:hypothetical protein
MRLRDVPEGSTMIVKISPSMSVEVTVERHIGHETHCRNKDGSTIVFDNREEHDQDNQA